MMILILLIIGFISICIFFIIKITKKKTKKTKIKEETKKNNLWIKVIIGIIILLIVVTLLFIIFKQTYIETVGDYTGYQLILTANYSDSGIDEQNLGSSAKKKIYNISQNDILYEPTFGGLWELNVDTEDGDVVYVISPYSAIIEIIKFEKDTVTIKNNTNTYNIEYNQEFNISSNWSTSDDINYSYVIEITKKE